MQSLEFVDQSETSNAGHDPRRWHPAQFTSIAHSDIKHICRHNVVRTVGQWWRHEGVVWNADSWLVDHVGGWLTVQNNATAERDKTSELFSRWSWQLVLTTQVETATIE